jgi:hypothetical protein
MKPAIKKLKSCLYSKPIGPSGFFARESFQPTKQVCDHVEMKENWTIAVCADCKAYVNRSQPTKAEVDAAPRKKKTSQKGTERH